MGNHLCKCGCLRYCEPRLGICCGRFAGKMNKSNVTSIVRYDEDSKESFLDGSDVDEVRSSFQSHISRSCDVFGGRLSEARDKIDGLIEADLFALEGIAKSLDLPIWSGDSVCDCQKRRFKQGRACLVLGNLLRNGDSVVSERLKVSISRPHLRVFTLTWNMNGKKATLQDLTKLACPEEKEQYDLLIVGLQEAPSCDAESVITEALGEGHSLVAAATMMSLQLFVFGKTRLDAHFEDVRVDKVGGGGFGAVVRRQKGAVAVSFKFKDSSFLFISSHLSPHESNVEERNSQFQRISQSLFSKSPSSRLSSCLTVTVEDDMAEDSPYSLHSSVFEESDLVVWLGDLNYRIQDHRSLVDALIHQNLYKSLWHKDQLSREIQRGNVFRGFREGPLAFRPTYKYDVGTDNYDTSPKERVPSWTDRILYKVKEGGNFIKVDVCDYDAVDSIKSSDHRPVKAVFTLNPW